ncbi:restriction endonuclease subunit S [Bifidobacterium adolescentis]|uniref:restriction endonuclease subunit S n=1 Tax=Bifidobacterium adolescentis TaxID=1680 RepID=UPI0034A35695
MPAKCAAPRATAHLSQEYRTPAWEQRKLSELVEIERGGSPRPIERYITDDPCGLNWVKIGDAPELGRYITQTTEKIKPEGLAKTRQVYPGDLVLSNSMSFGRPYIMAIKGCIHDGWLLIRDAQKHFDPIFLCHMLGAPQMLNQYRMFAAGSTVNNLNKELVGKAIVSLPSKDEQREIGIVLDRLDSLITLHQRKYDGCANPLFLERRISCRKPSHQNRCSATTTPSG